MMYICFFFCKAYIFYTSVLAPARFYLLSLGKRGSNKESAFRSKLNLQMLLDGTFLLVPSARDFYILLCMLKTFIYLFIHLFIYLFIYLFNSIFIYLFIYLFNYIFIYLFTYLHILNFFN